MVRIRRYYARIYSATFNFEPKRDHQMALCIKWTNHGRPAVDNKVDKKYFKGVCE